jgi:hypothetical protein
MNILILSCSYGVPDYTLGNSKKATTTSHIEYYLSKHHTVFNLSTNGSSNWQAIQRAHEFIDGNEVEHIPCGQDAYTTIQKPADINIDYVIWIGTSLLRDQHIIHVPTLDQCIAELQDTTYNEMKKLMQKIPTAKLIAVGGCGPIDETALRNVLSVHYCIPDWRAELLGMEYTEHLSGGAKLNLNDLITDPRLSKHLSMAQTVYTNMHGSDAFPDSSHPGGIAHKGLYEKILPHISI